MKVLPSIIFLLSTKVAGPAGCNPTRGRKFCPSTRDGREAKVRVGLWHRGAERHIVGLEYMEQKKRPGLSKPMIQQSQVFPDPAARDADLCDWHANSIYLSLISILLGFTVLNSKSNHCCEWPTLKICIFFRGWCIDMKYRIWDI